MHVHAMYDELRNISPQTVNMLNVLPASPPPGYRFIFDLFYELSAAWREFA